MTFSIGNDTLYAHTTNRTIAIATITYADRERAAIAFGMRPAVAAVVANGEMGRGQAERLGREVGLITK